MVVIIWFGSAGSCWYRPTPLIVRVTQPCKVSLLTHLAFVFIIKIAVNVNPAWLVLDPSGWWPPAQLVVRLSWVLVDAMHFLVELQRESLTCRLWLGLASSIFLTLLSISVNSMILLLVELCGINLLHHRGDKLALLLPVVVLILLLLLHLHRLHERRALGLLKDCLGFGWRCHPLLVVLAATLGEDHVHA